MRCVTLKLENPNRLLFWILQSPVGRMCIWADKNNDNWPLPHFISITEIRGVTVWLGDKHKDFRWSDGHEKHLMCSCCRLKSTAGKEESSESLFACLFVFPDLLIIFQKYKALMMLLDEIWPQQW